MPKKNYKNTHTQEQIDCMTGNLSNQQPWAPGLIQMIARARCLIRVDALVQFLQQEATSSITSSALDGLLVRVHGYLPAFS